MAYKLKIRLPDGRTKLCGCGTTSRERYDAMRGWVQGLKKGRTRRLDVLEAIVLKNVPLADAYDLRHDPDSILGLTGVRNVEPLVDRWHAAKAAARKGSASADDYREQVRRLIAKDKPFALSRITAAEIRKHLRALDVEDPTRNRHKAALSSFVQWLVDEGLLERNVVRDIPGWSEGQGRDGYYELEQAQAVLERIADPEHRAMFALAVGAGIEWQVVQRLRVRDLDFSGRLPKVWADGGKTAWRRRTTRILWSWAADVVREWVKGRLPDAPVFVRTGSDHGVLEAIREAATAARLPVLTFHDQRHTHAINALRAGYKPTTVAHQLGHRDTSLVWKRYGRYITDDRDYERSGHEQAESEQPLAVMR